ncbi:MULTISPECIES: hypothetical protein [unclassified Streptomyces]|uniref:hypothetical protein n=1 Tax=unclassified Streptomyces TaxID=2593676 RepID=UPI001F033C3D|nr:MULTISPECIES: hypothetical protein [unclassified Streptomyces]MCH0564506.1 hypothetical protein [Streptomyces sp. MUM 2J]MCH0572874.1 hypothetical protein [Streptomyces sp. MUM 136J]
MTVSRAAAHGVPPSHGDADRMETYGTVMPPPARGERFMAGGGGVGGSAKPSRRTHVIGFSRARPFLADRRQPDMGTRYPELSILPDDTVLVTGAPRTTGALPPRTPPGARLRRGNGTRAPGGRPGGRPHLPLRWVRVP